MLYLNVPLRRSNWYIPLHGSKIVVEDAKELLKSKKVKLTGFPYVYRWIPDDLRGPSQYEFMSIALIVNIVICTLTIVIFAIIFELIFRYIDLKQSKKHRNK